MGFDINKFQDDGKTQPQEKIGKVEIVKGKCKLWDLCSIKEKELSKDMNINNLNRPLIPTVVMIESLGGAIRNNDLEEATEIQKLVFINLLGVIQMMEEENELD